MKDLRLLLLRFTARCACSVHRFDWWWVVEPRASGDARRPQHEVCGIEEVGSRASSGVYSGGERDRR